MHHSPRKQPGGSRREKYADLEAIAGEGNALRRMERGNQPKARKFPLREDNPREERGSRHPRG